MIVSYMNCYQLHRFGNFSVGILLAKAEINLIVWLWAFPLHIVLELCGHTQDIHI